MKIVFLADDFPPQSFGGAGISTYDLARGMKKAGHQVFVVTTCRKESEAGEIDYNDLKVFKIASDYSTKWRAYISLYNKPVVRKLDELLKIIKPDVVHANNIHSYLSYHSLKIARQQVGTVIITFRDAMAFNFGKLNTKRYLENFDTHTTWFDHLKQARKRWNPFRNLFIKRYLKYANKLFAISNALKRALGQNGIDNVEVIHTGVLVSEWQALPDKIESFRKQHDLKNKKILLFGGRLSTSKGGGKALEVLTEISKEISNTVLLVTGSIDPYAHALQEEAKKLGIGEKIIFTGWMEQEEIKLAYAIADVVLVPSLCLDTFPRTVLEAMASGKPVIGTCYGGASEIIEDCVTGYIVNPFNVEKMSKKILDLLKNPKKVEEFGKAGLERVKTKFSLDEKVGQYISYYKDLLNNRI